MDDNRPKLRATRFDELLRLADVTHPEDEGIRSSMIAAMRAAAQTRVEGVTANKRRRQYGHAASLVVQCVHADGSPTGEAWLHELMADSLGTSVVTPDSLAMLGQRYAYRIDVPVSA